MIELQSIIFYKLFVSNNKSLIIKKTKMKTVNFKRNTFVITQKGKTWIECDSCIVARIDWNTESVIVKMPKYVGLCKKFSDQIQLVSAHYGLQIIYK